MDAKVRYKQLIKENNDVLNQLGDSYRRIAYNYTKKARGYGVRSLDTELKIKEVLEELTNYEQKKLDANIVIPNMTEYIENHIKELSKAPKKIIKVKELIAISVFILCIIAYFLINTYLNRKVPLGNPTNVNIQVVEKNNSNYFFLMWDENPLAKEGYTIKVYKELDSNNVFTKTISKNIDSTIGKQICELKEISYDNNSIYIFEIYTNATDDYKQSETIVIKYQK